MSRICKSRKSKHTIMAHQGFGELTIIKKDVEYHVPRICFDKEGRLKKLVALELKKGDSPEHDLLLSQTFGIRVQRG